MWGGIGRCDDRDVSQKGHVGIVSPWFLSPSFETGIWTAPIAPCSEEASLHLRTTNTVVSHVLYPPNQFHLSVTIARLLVATRCGCFCPGRWGDRRARGVQGAWGCDPSVSLILSAPPSFAPPDPIREHHPGVPSSKVPIRNIVRLRRDTEWRQYFARLIVFIAPTRPSWFMSLELHVLQQLPGINIHVLLPGKRTAVTQEPRVPRSASLRSNTLTRFGKCSDPLIILKKTCIEPSPEFQMPLWIFVIILCISGCCC